MKNEPKSSTAPNVYFPSLLYARPDEEAVRSYLSLQNAGEIALLAATMAPRHKKFDPVALADAAIDLHNAVTDSLRTRRIEELQRMNPSALSLLKTYLDSTTQTQYRDASGRLTGSASTNRTSSITSRTIYRDASGRMAGSADTSKAAGTRGGGNPRGVRRRPSRGPGDFSVLRG